MITVQGKLQQEEQKLTDKLEGMMIENDGNNIVNVLQADIQNRKETFRKIKGQVEALLDRFENEFLDFINQNY